MHKHILKHTKFNIKMRKKHCNLQNFLLFLLSHKVMSNSASLWTAACQNSLSLTISQSLPKFMSIESGMVSKPSHLLPLSSFAFSLSQHQGLSNESVLHIRWPKYWSFSIRSSNEYSGLISFRIDCLILQSKGL